MICQECGQRPANLHFTKIVNGEKSEINLCEHCAKEKGELSVFSEGAGFSFNSLLAGLLSFEQPIKEKTSSAFAQNEVLQCDRCKMTFQQFVKVGKFGCSNCYKQFDQQLEPVLRRLHSGNTNHSGKIPERIGGSIHIEKQVKLLRAELQELIMKEEFEQAATIRDQIRELENNLSSHQGEGQK
jgi:protein arginine kinase activator